MDRRGQNLLHEILFALNRHVVPSRNNVADPDAGFVTWTPLVDIDHSDTPFQGIRMEYFKNLNTNVGTQRRAVDLGCGISRWRYVICEDAVNINLRELDGGLGMVKDVLADEIRLRNKSAHCVKDDRCVVWGKRALQAGGAGSTGCLSEGGDIKPKAHPAHQRQSGKQAAHQVSMLPLGGGPKSAQDDAQGRAGSAQPQGSICYRPSRLELWGFAGVPVRPCDCLWQRKEGNGEGQKDDCKDPDRRQKKDKHMAVDELHPRIHFLWA
mmetsp:Transcript_111776/g.193986  ORF Transcript_111776/g.193986 Transcript_111776/m.193986 type:complete len:267 (-) Transcript_111776:881-1681(-)